MDPYEVAKDNKIVVVAEPLANIYGYYGQVEGWRMIHVNEMLPEYVQRYVVAHILHGALKRPDEMQLVKEKPVAQLTNREKAAHVYATKLLLDGEELGPIEGLRVQADRIWHALGERRPSQ